MSEAEHYRDLRASQQKLLDQLYYLYINCAGAQDTQFDAAMNIASALGLSKEFKQMIGG